MYIYISKKKLSFEKPVSINHSGLNENSSYMLGDAISINC